MFDAGQTVHFRFIFYRFTYEVSIQDLKKGLLDRE